VGDPNRAGAAVRTAGWAAVAVLAAVLYGPEFVGRFRPPDGTLNDFLQEWLSARNVLAGRPAYTPQAESIRWHMPDFTPDPAMFLRWNAHPPGAVLLAVPFGHLPFRDACLAWNVVGFALFLAVLAAAVRELRVGFRPYHLPAAVALGLVCDPLHVQQVYGQLNYLLFALVTAGWLADRRGRPALAGLLLGAAAGVKLYPGFLLVYLVGTRRRRAAAGWVVGAVAVNAAALAAFGPDAFRTYLTDVLPALDWYRSDWRNLSAEGFWRRLFDPHERQRVVPLARLPEAAAAGTWAVRLVLAAVCFVASWRADTPAARDRAFAAAVFAMHLASPIAWAHYLVVAAGPLLLLWDRLTGFARRMAFYVAVGLLWWPEIRVPAFAFIARSGATAGAATARQLVRYENPPVSPAFDLGALSLSHYAVWALFLLALTLPAGRADPDVDRRSGGG
jgi:hypothetical protein